MDKPISKGQMKRLQVLYSQLARHTDQGSDRASRMAWATELTGRPITSFSELQAQEATSLIDTLQGRLGLKAAPRPRKRLSRDQAHRAGVDGRRGDTTYAAQPQMASAEDLAVIERFYTRLGWTRAQFDAWLASSRSPLKRRARPTIASTADANAVRWALKGMLKQRGLWRDEIA